MWTCSITSLIAILNRVYVRIIRRWGWCNFDWIRDRKKWPVSDLLVLVSWIIMTFPARPVFMIWVRSQLRGGFVPNTPEAVAYRKMAFATQVVDWVGAYLIKMAFLCFYGEFVSKKVLPKTWWAIRITWALVIMGLIATELIYWLQCIPLSTFW